MSSHSRTATVTSMPPVVRRFTKQVMRKSLPTISHRALMAPGKILMSNLDKRGKGPMHQIHVEISTILSA